MTDDTSEVEKMKEDEKEAEVIFQNLRFFWKKT
jgi:hypothetical protein